MKKQSKATPEMVIEVLNSQGVEITYDQAKKVLAFLKEIADIAVKHYLKSE